MHKSTTADEFTDAGSISAPITSEEVQVKDMPSINFNGPRSEAGALAILPDNGVYYSEQVRHETGGVVREIGEIIPTAKMLTQDHPHRLKPIISLYYEGDGTIKTIDEQRPSYADLSALGLVEVTNQNPEAVEAITKIFDRLQGEVLNGATIDIHSLKEELKAIEGVKVLEKYDTDITPFDGHHTCRLS